MAKLVFKIRDGEDMEYPLTAESTTLGRNESNDIVINNSWISSRHAIFKKGADGVYELTDLGSSNGTFVNGEKVEGVKLKDGDAVSFGQLDTIFENKPKQPAASPTPAKPSAEPSTPKPTVVKPSMVVPQSVPAPVK